MKVLAISDIHGNFYRLGKLVESLKKKSFDLIIIVGDLTNFGSMNEAKEVLDIISKINHKALFYVPGNCDPRELLTRAVPTYETSWLHGRIVIHENLILAGIGGSNPSPFNTPSELTEEEIQRLLLRISKSWKDLRGSRLLLSHTPPYGTLLDVTYYGDHVGSKALRSFLEHEDVRLCICGHIHEARGIDRLNETLLLNPGSLEKGFYAIIEIKEGGKITANLRRC